MGHMAKQCPEPVKNSFRRQCVKCGSFDHVARVCSADSQQMYPDADEDKTKPVHEESKAREPAKAKTRTPQEPANTTTSTSQKPTKTTTSRADDTNDIRLAGQLKEKGNSAFKSEDFETAIDYYTQAIRWHPNGDIYYSNRAAAYVNQKRFRLALLDCQQAMSMQENPKAKLLVRLGRCQYALGRPAAALVALRRALTIDPNDEMAQIFREKSLQLQNHERDYEDARSRNHWRMAQRAYEQCIDAIRKERGEVPLEWKCWEVALEVARGCWDRATATLDRALGEHPNSPDLLSLRALTLFLTGKLKESKDQTVSVLRLDPDSAGARNLRSRVRDVEKLKEEGNGYFKAMQWELAAEKYKCALQLVGDEVSEGKGGHIRAVLLSNRAATNVKLGLHKEAKIDINTSLELNPSSYKALRIRGSIHMHNEDYEAAVEDFSNAIEEADSESAKHSIKLLLHEADDLLDAQRNQKKDHYTILGGIFGAEIKKAFRQQSLKHHPDKGGNAEKFKVLAEAYSVLSDLEQRRLYDMKMPSYEYDDYTDPYCAETFDERYTYDSNSF
ncbi:hypothetical protein EWM64_g5352 [Hericium alpestre]|uniref:J domain-containing protein n=1 Tax=Hericium alpestre TaxID=135208 RepID=A0A4Y9ZXB3_9AGAM|nr:hypothetical protein EWM64_g5352 [Hericium alpestre]